MTGFRHNCNGATVQVYSINMVVITTAGWYNKQGSTLQTQMVLKKFGWYNWITWTSYTKESLKTAVKYMFVFWSLACRNVVGYVLLRYRYPNANGSNVQANHLRIPKLAMNEIQRGRNIALWWEEESKKEGASNLNRWMRGNKLIFLEFYSCAGKEVLLRKGPGWGKCARHAVCVFVSNDVIVCFFNFTWFRSWNPKKDLVSTRNM